MTDIGYCPWCESWSRPHDPAKHPADVTAADYWQHAVDMDNKDAALARIRAAREAERRG